MFGATEYSVYLIIAYVLQAFNVWMSIFFDVVILLSHGLVEPAPLRVMTDSDSWRKGVVETYFFESFFCPETYILEVALVVGAGESDVVRKEDGADGMLISVDCIGC